MRDDTSIYPAATKVLAQLKSAGKTVILFSNFPALASEAASFLAAHGVTSKHYDHIVTAGEVCRRHYKDQPSLKYYALPSVYALNIWKDSQHLRVEDIAEANVALLGDISPFSDDAEGFAFYVPYLKQLAQHKLRLICINPDRHSPQQGSKVMTSGSIAAYYAENLGGQVEYYGKPHSVMYAQALEYVVGPVLAIGDGYATDIVGAKRHQLDSLLITGGLLAAQLQGMAEGKVMEHIHKLAQEYATTPCFIMQYLE